MFPPKSTPYPMSCSAYNDVSGTASDTAYKIVLSMKIDSMLFRPCTLVLLLSWASFDYAVIGNLMAADHPNVVLILADDFGVGDVQAHYPENKIATPHLDQLASEGLRYVDAHSSSAVCTPTRYGLLTGRYNWRTPLQEWVLAAYEPPLIAEGRLTLPQFLSHQGYRTHLIGKWHLGWDWPGNEPNRMTRKHNGLKFRQLDLNRRLAGGPIDRGFDSFFGVDVPNFPPFAFIDNDRFVEQPTDNTVWTVPKASCYQTGWRERSRLPIGK